MEFSHGEIQTYYCARIPGIKWAHRKELRLPCPVHRGERESFSINTETGFSICHSACGRGFDLLSFEMEITGCAFAAAKKQVFELIGRPTEGVEWDVEATYDYTDEDGNLLYQVVRRSGKKFTQRRPGQYGKWIYGLGGIAAVPYNLPKVIAAEFCAITEGEADANNLTRAGIVATCNNGGAEHFKPEIAHWFTGKNVAIFPDNDEPGRKHAIAVAGILAGVAASVRIVEIPNMPAKGDVSDFLRKPGATVEQLLDLHERAQEWNAEWQFGADVPNENDKYLRTLPQYVREVGGMEEFWDIPANQGIETPWEDLNERLGGGMRASEVYVIAANQGAGKTSMALQFMLHAMKSGKCPLLFSMEMGHRDTFQRMCAIEAGVDLTQFRQFQKLRKGGPIFETMKIELGKATRILARLPMFVTTKTGVTPEFLMNESERLKKRSRIDLIVVDHMQLMASAKTTRGDYEKFTAISRATKETAMEMKLPVLLVSQTSRNSSHDKRTELEVSDCRGSGAIEEDAAAVMLIFDCQEDKARTMANKTYHSGPCQVWLKLGKNRFGPSGCSLALMHHKQFTRFELIGENYK